MKKVSVFLVLFLPLCMVLPASAQVNLGILGGLNLANMRADPDQGVDLSTRTGIGIGGVVDIGLGNTSALRLEPMFLQKGSKIGVEGLGELGKIKVSYIEVPVMLKLAFGTGNAKPYVMAGPTIGFVLSAKLDDEDIKDEIKNTDFGLSFGGGVSIPAGNNSIFVEARYALGLSDINDDPDDPDTKLKTKGIQIFAGITFPLGGK